MEGSRGATPLLSPSPVPVVTKGSGDGFIAEDETILSFPRRAGLAGRFTLLQVSAAGLRLVRPVSLPPSNQPQVCTASCKVPARGRTSAQCFDAQRPVSYGSEEERGSGTLVNGRRFWHEQTFRASRIRTLISGSEPEE